jgi:hypothetical protein
VRNRDPNNEDPTVFFLKSLYDRCEQGNINLRLLPSGKNLFLPFSQIVNIPIILKGHHQQNAYFAVASRTSSNGTKQGINEIPAWGYGEKDGR